MNNRIYKKKIKSVLCLALCLVLMCGICAPAWAETVDEHLVIPEELKELVENYLDGENIPHDRVSIGYYYSGTGEEWFYNEDLWLYSASVYKLPMVMELAEKVNAGEITQDTDIEGKSVTQIEELILQYSNNDWAHIIRQYLGGDEKWRTEAMKYARMEKGEYNPDYVLYSYINSKFITQVGETLLNEQERFPMVNEFLLEAMPEHYFRPGVLEYGTYKVAQKYGSYEASDIEKYNHAVGIIYTPHPFVLTVMTYNVTRYEPVIANIASIFTAYSLSLDDQIAAMATPTPAPTPEPTPEATPEPMPEPVQAQTEPSTDAVTEEPAAKKDMGGLIILAAFAAAAAAAAGTAVFLIKREQERERARRAARRRAKKARMEAEAKNGETDK